MADPNKFTILLIDDDNALRDLYTTELLSRHYKVAEATNGEEGLAQVKKEKPNIILLDIMMPQLDGIATLSRLKQDPSAKDIPVIMLTNFGQENLVQQAFSTGATDYLLKYKVTPSEMAEKVAQVLSTPPASA